MSPSRGRLQAISLASGVGLLSLWSLPVKAQLLYPRGNALTDTMPFTDRDEVHWLVYIEGVPPDPPSRRWGQTVLPGRRLRFDSAMESRITIPVPAGSPYLTDHRLQSLLDQAEPVFAGSRSRAAATPAHPPPTIESGARGAQPVRAASEAPRWLWRWASDRAPPLVNLLEQFVSALLTTLQGLEGAMRSGLHRGRR